MSRLEKEEVLFAYIVVASQGVSLGFGEGRKWGTETSLLCGQVVERS